MPFQRTCPFCQEVFTTPYSPESGRGRYCSKACSNSANFRAPDYSPDPKENRRREYLRNRANPNRVEWQRNYSADHREEVRVRGAVWYAANRERLAAIHRVAHEANRERDARVAQAWRKAHPEENREKTRQRRARLRGNGPVERISEQAVYDRDGGLCRLCGKPVRRDQMSLDHIVPIAAGGSHTTLNVQLAHRLCNYRRQHRGPAQLRMLG
jgi:5-methylcytosine-specific restriction endonuclease McrA